MEEIYVTQANLDYLAKLESLENQYNQAQEDSKIIDYHMKKVKSKGNFDKLLKQVSKRSKR